MTLGNSLVNAVLIVRAVSREGRQGIGELVEQRVSRTASSLSFLVSSIATISPLSPSMPICSLRQDRQRDVPCFSTSHSPAPPSFRPVAVHQQMQRTGPEPPEGRHFQRLAPPAQCRVIRHRESEAEQSDEETISPSVCRNARPKTVRIVSAVVIASAE